MEILYRFWFGCLDQNFIYHNFLWLCLQGNFTHSCLLVPGAFLFFYFLTEIFLLSSLMVYPSSHKTPNDISGAVSFLEECEST